MLTIQDLKDRILQTYDPDDILELLNISAEELLEQFEHKLEEKYDGLCKEFEDDTPEGESSS
jgi:translation initiation factor 2 alpha subunit (eIF-2alpha)